MESQSKMTPRPCTIISCCPLVYGKGQVLIQIIVTDCYSSVILLVAAAIPESLDVRMIAY